VHVSAQMAVACWAGVLVWLNGFDLWPFSLEEHASQQRRVLWSGVLLPLDCLSGRGVEETLFLLFLDRLISFVVRILFLSGRFGAELGSASWHDDLFLHWLFNHYLPQLDFCRACGKKVVNEFVCSTVSRWVQRFVCICLVFGYRLTDGGYLSAFGLS